MNRQNNSIVFFNYLALEYGGGTAKYFIEVSSQLKKRYPQLEISIVTFDKKIIKKILFLYSLYFMKDVKKQFQTPEQKKTILKKLGSVSYYQASSIRDLKQKLHRYDVVYCKNDFLEIAILRFLVGYNHLKKVIIGFHTPVYYEITNTIQSKIHNMLYGSVVYSLLILKAHKFHVLNAFDERLLKKRFSKKNVIKIHNPFDFKQFEKMTKKKIPKKTSHNIQTKILWVGRLTSEKGIDDLLNIIRHINQTKQAGNIVWTIVGEGEYQDKVMLLAKEYQNVNYVGFIPNDKLANIYQQNDIFITTSKFETFPYMLLEAQTFGLPCLAYNIHGCDEIIENGKSGYLVANLQEFEKKLTKLVHHSPFKKAIIKKNIMKKFDNKKIFDDIYNLFTA